MVTVFAAGIVLLVVGGAELGWPVAAAVAALTVGLFIGSLYAGPWWPLAVSIQAVVDIVLLLVIFGEDIAIK